MAEDVSIRFRREGPPAGQRYDIQGVMFHEDHITLVIDGRIWTGPSIELGVSPMPIFERIREELSRLKDPRMGHTVTINMTRHLDRPQYLSFVWTGNCTETA